MDLSQKKLDALREVGNIGSGNAASALAKFLNLCIDMSVPTATVVPLNEVSERAGGKDAIVTGVMLNMTGTISGRFLLIIPENTSLRLLHRLMPNSIAENLLSLNEVESSCLKEIGNILAGSFSNALSILTQTPIINSLPYMNFDSVGAQLNRTISGLPMRSNEVVMIETSFFEEEKDLRIHIFLMPVSLESLFEKIGFGS